MYYDRSILSEKVAQDLRDMILQKDLQPGDKIPNELDLAKEFNVSRSTIREAIKALASTNVLEVKRGRGTFVTERPGILKDPLGISFLEDKDLLSHLFEVRLIVEPQMAELAVMRATDEEINIIKRAYNKVQEAILNGENHTDSDIDFHNEISKCTRNPILNRIVPIINDGIMGGYVKTKDLPESYEVVLTQHKKIMEAIEKRDADSAKKTMEEHILYGLQQSKDMHL